MTKIDPGLIHDPSDRYFPFADPTIEPGPGASLPAIEATYKGLSNVVTIQQGDQVIRISTRRIRLLIDDLENFDSGGDDE